MPQHKSSHWIMLTAAASLIATIGFAAQVFTGKNPPGTLPAAPVTSAISALTTRSTALPLPPDPT